MNELLPVRNYTESERDYTLLIDFITSGCSQIQQWYNNKTDLDLSLTNIYNISHQNKWMERRRKYHATKQFYDNWENQLVVKESSKELIPLLMESSLEKLNQTYQNIKNKSSKSYDDVNSIKFITESVKLARLLANMSSENIELASTSKEDNTSVNKYIEDILFNNGDE